MQDKSTVSVIELGGFMVSEHVQFVAKRDATTFDQQTCMPALCVSLVSTDNSGCIYYPVPEELRECADTYCCDFQVCLGLCMTLIPSPSGIFHLGRVHCIC